MKMLEHLRIFILRYTNVLIIIIIRVLLNGVTCTVSVPGKSELVAT